MKINRVISIKYNGYEDCELSTDVPKVINKPK